MKKLLLILALLIPIQAQATVTVKTLYGGYPAQVCQPSDPNGACGTSTGTGTVTEVSVATVHGFSGTVSNSTTTPVISLGTTVNGLLYGNGSVVNAASITGTGNVVESISPTLTTPNLGTPSAVTLTNGTGLPESGVNSLVASGKTFTANNSITIAGTDSTTMTFPSTSATIARTDAGNTFTGHQTIEGVTSTGAQGTGNFVFDNSPTITTPTISGNLTTNITGSTQCVHANSSGVISGTGSDCGSGGGSGTVTSVSVASANGFSGTVANATTTPTITIQTSVNGILQGNGTSVSSASTTGTGNIVEAVSPTLTTDNITTSETLSNNGTGPNPSDGIIIENTTPAINNNQQYSPRIHWQGQGWETNTSASQPVDYEAYLIPTQGVSNPGGQLSIASSINGGAYADILHLNSGGTLTTISNSGITENSGTVGFSANTVFNNGGVTTGSYFSGGSSSMTSGTIYSGNGSSGITTGHVLNASISGNSYTGSGLISMIYSGTNSGVNTLLENTSASSSGDVLQLSDSGTGNALNILSGPAKFGELTASTPVYLDSNKLLQSGSYSGNTTEFGTVTGTTPSGNLAGWDGNGNLVNTTAIPSATTATTQSPSNNSTEVATTAYVTTAVTNGIAGVNPAVAVQAATTAAADTSGLTYNNGVSGIGATFTGTNNTALTIDGFTFTALGQRLLVKNDTQSPSGAFNGIYYVTQVQALALPPILTRSLDYDSSSDINNTGSIPVVNGTVNGSTSWVLTSSVTNVGTDPLTFTKFSINPTTILTTTGTVTGATSQSQTFTNGVTLGNIVTGTQCLHANSSGVVTGTGSDCGSGGMVYPSGSGVPLVSSGSSWGTTFPQLGATGLNWENWNFNNINMNWSNIGNLNSPTGINWNQNTFNFMGINWQNATNIGKNAGINWQGDMFNNLGINWQSWIDPGAMTVNWYDLNIIANQVQTVNAAAGNVKLYDSSGTNWIDISAPSSINGQASWNLWAPPQNSITSSATPTINVDTTRLFYITALAVNITSLTITGTPQNGQLLELRILDNGTARSLTFGSSFTSTTVTIPTTTVLSTTLRILFEYNSGSGKWECIATA